MRAADIAGLRDDLPDPQEVQKSVIETDDAAASFRDGGQHVVHNDFFRGSVEERKGVDQSPVQCFLFLAVGKLDIKHPAVRFGNRQGIQFSYGRAIGQTAEVAPIDLHLLSRSGLKADEGLPVSAFPPLAEVSEAPPGF
jgi:hypothetical protein